MYNGTENLKMMTWRIARRHSTSQSLIFILNCCRLKLPLSEFKCFEKSLLIGIITINRIAKLNETVGKKITREIIELNCSQLNINQFKRSYILLCLVAVRWRKVNKLPVCFEAKGNHFGRFYVPEGRLAAIKMVHLYGYVSCHVHNQYFWSYWGCGDSPASRELVDKVNAVITDSSNNILLPPLQFQTSSNLKWYRVPGYNSLSPELVLPSFSSPEKVHSNQELRVWFGENLVNISEGDNGGTVCADVYALFVWLKRRNCCFF